VSGDAASEQDAAGSALEVRRSLVEAGEVWTPRADCGAELAQGRGRSRQLHDAAWARTQVLTAGGVDDLDMPVLGRTGQMLVSLSDSV
jgi:hypothetical protein